MYEGIGIEFCWVPSHCGLYWNEISDKLEFNSLLKKTVYKQIEKSKPAIPSCSRYLARVIYKLRLNSWNTNYSQNLTCVCKKYLLNTYCLNVLLLQLFQKNGYDLNAYNNVRDILYNTDVITNTVKSIVHSPVGKFV